MGAEEQENHERQLVKTVADKARRKLRAQKEGDRSAWYGLGVFGMVGWSVAIPTLLGALLGRWLDARYPLAGVSWTMILLVVGLLLGCITAWQWIAAEQRDMERERDD